MLRRFKALNLLFEFLGGPLQKADVQTTSKPMPFHVRRIGFQHFEGSNGMTPTNEFKNHPTAVHFPNRISYVGKKHSPKASRMRKGNPNMAQCQAPGNPFHFCSPIQSMIFLINSLCQRIDCQHIEGSKVMTPSNELESKTSCSLSRFYCRFHCRGSNLV